MVLNINDLVNQIIHFISTFYNIGIIILFILVVIILIFHNIIQSTYLVELWLYFVVNNISLISYYSSIQYFFLRRTLSKDIINLFILLNTNLTFARNFRFVRNINRKYYIDKICKHFCILNLV